MNIPIWKPIPSNPKYLVSSDGQVRHRNSEKCRALQPLGNYLYVNFWQDKKLRIRLVHVLVAEAFIGPRPPGPDGEDVRHLDGDSHHNQDTNLSYGSKKQNAEDRERHGRTARGEKNGNSRLSNVDADLVRLLYSQGGITQYELATLFCISQAQINNIVLKKQRVAAVRELAIAADPALGALA